MTTCGRKSPRSGVVAGGFEAGAAAQEKRFAFDQAFDAQTDSQRVFEATAQPLIGAGSNQYT